MAFRVVCISHTEEAGGETVGHRVAEALGFRYVDEEIISKASRTAQVDPQVVAATEKKQPLLQRLFDALAAATVIGSPVAIASGVAGETVPYSGMVRAASDDLRLLIRAAIHEVARNGDAVIVAHAASLALAGHADVLRVLVTAPDATRSERLAKSRSLDIDGAAEAIAKSDAGRQNYFRTFYEIDQELPTHYDLVLSTEVLTPDQVTALVVAAARA